MVGGMPNSWGSKLDRVSDPNIWIRWTVRSNIGGDFLSKLEINPDGGARKSEVYLMEFPVLLV